MTGKLQSLQILRGIAALMVVLIHATGIAPWAWFGSAGVDIFFVLSGVVIYQSARRSDPLTFLRNRFLRVVPLYFLLTLIWLPIGYAMGDGTLEPNRLIAAFTFWPLATPSLPQGWSLSFEMLFYLGAALVIFDHRMLYLLASLWIGAYVAGSHFIGSPIILEFFFGLAIGTWMIRPLNTTFALAMLGAGFAVILLAGSTPNLFNSGYIFNGQLAWFRVLVWGLPAALIVRGAVGLENFLREQYALAYLGDASFSIYLAHWPVMKLLDPIKLPTSLLLVIGVLAGLAVYHCLEKPLRTMQFYRQKSPLTVNS